MLQDAPSTHSTISVLEDIFTIHGYLCVMVFDNATIFTSEGFKTYCKARGIFLNIHVQTLKKRLHASE